MSNKFTVYEGKFICKTCKKEVKSLRLYKDTGMVSWMCSDKHLTEVKLYHIGYKKKRDYEREERK
jgi:hypothetical protein